MKENLSATDVYLLKDELKKTLLNSRIDKVYQISERELKVKIRVMGAGSVDLIIAPGYLCITSYPRESPPQPSSFAMQLRKHLRGGFIEDVCQPGFDRILEFRLCCGENTYFLIVELFSKGNVILCDAERKILGLLEWQRWKDRRLGVGQTYAYPPSGTNPLEIGSESFKEILLNSDKKLVSTLATGVGLGGIYSENLCFICGMEKNQAASDLSAEDIARLYSAFSDHMEKIGSGVLHPAVISGEDTAVDVLPFDLEIYAEFEHEYFPRLNDAIDAYFSKGSFARMKNRGEEKLLEKIAKASKIKEKQQETIERLESKAVEYRAIGDYIYQNFQLFEKISSLVAEQRDRGISWKEIGERISGKTIDGIKFRGVDNMGNLLLEVDG